MRSQAWTVVTAIALAIIQMAAVAVLPMPLALINLPLMLVSALALNLRFQTALIAAGLAGLLTDLLSLGGFGIYTVASLLTVIVVTLLLFRVLTHHTLTALAGANAAVFLLYHLIAFLLSSVYWALATERLIHPATGTALLFVLAAVPLQMLLAILFRLAAVRFRNYIGHFFILK